MFIYLYNPVFWASFGKDEFKRLFCQHTHVDSGIAVAKPISI